MLNQDFCTYLEYELCNIFKSSNRKELRGFWCDGIFLADATDTYSKKYINDNQTALLKAFVGKDGRTEFELLLKFGPQALSKYARNLDIRDCIPELNEREWLSIDVKNRKIQIQLH